MISKRSNTASAKGRDIVPGVPAQKGSVMESGDWAVVDNYGYDVVQIIAVKPQTVSYRRPSSQKDGRTMAHKVVFAHPDQQRALNVAAALKAAKGEKRGRDEASRALFYADMGRIIKEGSR